LKDEIENYQNFYKIAKEKKMEIIRRTKLEKLIYDKLDLKDYIEK
jgi:hypothetical protein